MQNAFLLKAEELFICSVIIMEWLHAAYSPSPAPTLVVQVLETKGQVGVREQRRWPEYPVHHPQQMVIVAF